MQRTSCNSSPARSSGLKWYTAFRVLLGRVPGRESAEKINVVTSVGLGIQDMALAAKVYAAATRAGAGLQIPL